MEFSQNTKKSTFWRYLIVCLVGTLSSISSLFGDFVFDDTEVILNNADILPSTPISQVFVHDYWGTNLSHNLSHKSYRPLTILTFRLNYVVFGGLNPWSFHLLNIILHVYISILVYQVFCVILGKERYYFGFLGALLFSVHPVHSEAVCGIVGRADLLSAMFFFLSFLSFAKARESKGCEWLWVLVSIFLGAISMFCKEQGITIIGILSIYDILMSYDTLKLWKPWCHHEIKKEISLNIKFFFIRHLVFIFSAFSLMFFRYYLMNFQIPSFQVFDNPASFEKDWLTRVLSYNYIFFLNIWLMLCPEWLCFDWSMGCIPTVKYTDRRVLFVLIFWIVLALITWVGFSAKNKRHQRDVLLSIFLMVIPFLPASNLFFRVGFVLAERVLYIPSAGFCLLVVCGIENLTKAFPFSKRDIQICFSLLILVFLIRSNDRSKDWMSEQSLFTSGLRVCPLNAKVHYNVAIAALNSGDVDKAVTEYEEAIRLFPDYYQAYNNLANILKNDGKLNEAERLLRRALEIHREFPTAWMNLGVVLAQKREFREAEDCYFTALSYRKNYPDCYYNLGKLYLEENKLKEAEKAWLVAIKLKPTFTIAWNNLLILTSQSGNDSRAVALAEEALKVLQDEPSIHFNLANSLGKLGRFPESERHFLTAVQLKPDNAQYHLNLGVLYHRWKKYKAAELHYKAALSIQPNFKAAIDNSNMLKKIIAGV